jgi:endonuclease-3
MNPEALLVPAGATTARLRAIADRLAAVYGRPRVRRGDPLDGLVETILSQNTSDRNSERAFAGLKRAFPTWAKAAAAPPRAIERAIRSGGLARIKSRRIKAVLRAIRAREGSFDLRQLRTLAKADAERRLTGLPGVGPKTRACVLLFCCGREAFPVDTHVHRIARRLGLVRGRASAEQAHACLEPRVPRGRALDLHLNLIRLGREVCRPGRPRCHACALGRLCAHKRAAS